MLSQRLHGTDLLIRAGHPLVATADKPCFKARIRNKRLGGVPSLPTGHARLRAVTYAHGTFRARRECSRGSARVINTNKCAS